MELVSQSLRCHTNTFRTHVGPIFPLNESSVSASSYIRCFLLPHTRHVRVKTHFVSFCFLPFSRSVFPFFFLFISLFFCHFISFHFIVCLFTFIFLSLSLSLSLLPYIFLTLLLRFLCLSVYFALRHFCFSFFPLHSLVTLMFACYSQSYKP
jgi:hypothetical protein